MQGVQELKDNIEAIKANIAELKASNADKAAVKPHVVRINLKRNKSLLLVLLDRSVVWHAARGPKYPEQQQSDSSSSQTAQ